MLTISESIWRIKGSTFNCAYNFLVSLKLLQNQKLKLKQSPLQIPRALSAEWSLETCWNYIRTFSNVYTLLFLQFVLQLTKLLVKHCHIIVLLQICNMTYHLGNFSIFVAICSTNDILPYILNNCVGQCSPKWG